MINYFSVQGERNAVLRRDALNACALSRLSTHRFTKRRAVDFKRDRATRCR
jgi:hypothetical protein